MFVYCIRCVLSGSFHFQAASNNCNTIQEDATLACYRTHFHIGLYSIITKASHVVSTHTSQNTAECQSEHAVAVCVIMQTCACPSTSALTKLIGNIRYYRWGGGGGGGKGGGGGDGGVSGGDGGGGTGR